MDKISQIVFIGVDLGLRAYPENQSIAYFRMNYRDAEKYIEKALCASASLWLLIIFATESAMNAVHK